MTGYTTCRGERGRRDSPPALADELKPSSYAIGTSITGRLMGP